MEYNQWSETLRIINADNDLNESNIIEKIKEKLGENSDTYREWHDSQFNISHTFNDQFTLLHVAIRDGYGRIVEALIKNGVDANALDEDNRTPLHYAAQDCSEEVMLALIGIGANPDIRDVNGRTPLGYYTQRNNEGTKNVLRKGQESANILHKIKFDTCLAAKNGHIEALKTLIAKGAKIDAVDENGLTTLYWTARNGYTEILETLIAKGARIDVVDKDGLTALHWAARNGHTETVRALMERVDVNVADKMGYTPLYPDKKNQDLIRVEGNKEMLKELEDCEGKIGENCRLGGLSVKEAIKQGDFIRSGELMRFEAMSSSVNSSLDNISLPFSVKESIQKIWSGA